MTSKNYLQVSYENSNSRKFSFSYDLKLKFDPYAYEKHQVQFNDWTIWDDVKCGENGEWIDEELDISDIPPTVFFLGIQNTYGQIYDTHVPTDCSLGEFSKRAAERIHTKKYVFKIDWLLDIEYLNSTGKIKSTKKFNRNACISEYLWQHEGRRHGTIQSIIKNCRNF